MISNSLNTNCSINSNLNTLHNHACNTDKAYKSGRAKQYVVNHFEKQLPKQSMIVLIAKSKMF